MVYTELFQRCRVKEWAEHMETMVTASADCDGRRQTAPSDVFRYSHFKAHKTRQNNTMPRKYETSSRRYFIVGPASKTMDQH